MPPAAPRPVAKPLTVRQARRRSLYLWIACRPCAAGRRIEISQIPDRFDHETFRDLHLAGRFKCGDCGTAAVATMVQTDDRSTSVCQLERWTEVSQ